MELNTSLVARQACADPNVAEQTIRHERDCVASAGMTATERPGTGTTADAEQRTPVVDPEDDFPEGGTRAWLVVLGACFCLFPSFGFQVSIGTLQDYLGSHQLSSYTSRDVGWIPSVFVYLSLGLGIWVGPLFDRYGPRWIAMVGSVGYVAMMFLLAECTRYWEFMLCLGVLGGVTSAMLGTTSLACVAHWFKQRRGLTQGIAMCGSSFGGLTIPLALRNTLPKYGYQWSIRILAFVFLVCLMVGNLLMRARFPPSRSARKKSIISLSVFADLRFSLLAVSVFCFEMVLFGSLGMVPTYASISSNYPQSTGFYLIAVLNGASSIGRLASGYTSDKAGRFNTLLASAVVVLLAMAAIWVPFGQADLGALYTFITIFGFMTGCWMALVPACVGQLCRADEFGRYYGSLYFLASLATLICVPIGGEFVQVIGPRAMVVFYCAMLSLGVIAFAVSRWACLGWRWEWAKKV
jgi:MFS family permease